MKKRIVIAGGGFAGLYAAKYLDKTIARHADVEVVLISKDWKESGALQAHINL
jgi:NADH dehydrogenase FAD-containing subunit